MALDRCRFQNAIWWASNNGPARDRTRATELIMNRDLEPNITVDEFQLGYGAEVEPTLVDVPMAVLNPLPPANE